jgi:opacity protein-like surface antigen
MILSAVFLVLLFAHAQAEGLGLKGIGGRLSFVKPENVDGTIGFGAHADLGNIVQNVILFPSVEYWKKSEGSSDASASISAWQINADAKYMFPSESNLKFFAGGGLALIFNKGSVDVDIPDFLGGQDISGSSTSSDIGLNLLGGLDVPVSESLEVNAMAVFTVSDGSVFRITGGLTYRFPE